MKGEQGGKNERVCCIKIARDTKKCVIKRKLKFKEYKNCLEATQLENKIS